ncbi:AIPR family protein [Paenibacillus sp. MMS20-IR301]|uniref:AIPR family protein n=1 Tax=Paenibacillus sp. MMS20-IR301 TaxID=2895946 RepID=UPI0028ECBEE9|nr:AIPR family protein [Paenibacillus sp. MMS20-IR301]WNS42285.1 AIPR family protein [Paenibacillus sp. MMS20-IR301]
MVFMDNFLGRQDLISKYKDNALLLYSLELRLQLEDIQSVASDALTDGNDDKKCDLVYIDEEEGLAIIAQGYHSQKDRNSAPANKACDLNTAVTWLFNEDIENLPLDIRAASIQLRQAINDGKIHTIQIWYVHNLPESKNVSDEMNAVKLSLMSALKSYTDNPKDINVISLEVGKETLNRWYKSSSVPILVNDPFEISTPNGGYQIVGDNWTSYMTAIPLTFLFDNYKKYKDDLFSSNIRGYLGSLNKKNNINNGIKRSVESTPSNFMIYNNGLTILVNNFEEVSIKNISVTGMSIVNGAQTTGAIGSVLNRPREDALVSVRFIKCDDPKILRDIIEFNNKQNVVASSDFRSTDEIQDNLRRQFNEIRSVVYLGGRRGGSEDKIKRYSNLIPHDLVAQCLSAFHQDPNTAYNRKKEIWENNTLYSSIFSEKTTARHMFFVYSLYQAIEKKKENLKLNKTNLSTTEQDIYEYLSVRGSTWVLLAAIASSMDNILNKPLRDLFDLKFKQEITFEEAVLIWEHPLETALPFVSSLLPAVKNGVKTKDVINNSVKDFKEKTASILKLLWATPGLKINFEEFSSRTETN